MQALMRKSFPPLETVPSVSSKITISLALIPEVRGLAKLWLCATGFIFRVVHCSQGFLSFAERLFACTYAFPLFDRLLTAMEASHKVLFASYA